MARLLRYAPAREHMPHDPYFTIIVHFPVRNKNLKAKSPAKSKKPCQKQKAFETGLLGRNTPLLCGDTVS